MAHGLLRERNPAGWLAVAWPLDPDGIGWRAFAHLVNSAVTPDAVGVVRLHWEPDDGVGWLEKRSHQAVRLVSKTAAKVSNGAKVTPTW